MAKNTKLSNVAVNAGMDAECALANSGYLRLYSGTQPATVDTAITDQILLASPRFGATAFGATVSGVATANAITAGTGTAEATASGIAASWFRVFESDGTTALWDGTVGIADLPAPGDEYNCQLTISGVSTPIIKTGQTVNITGFVYTRPKSA